MVANLLYLAESEYTRKNDNRPVMGISIWAQYVLDNFATVDKTVAELRKELFRIDAPKMPNGVESSLHLAISDASGNSAIFQYVNGNLVVYAGRQYQVMTNSPIYSKQCLTRKTRYITSNRPLVPMSLGLSCKGSTSSRELRLRNSP